MRVAYLLDYPIGLHGGAQISTLTIAKLLESKFQVKPYILAPANSLYDKLITTGEVEFVPIKRAKKNLKIIYKDPVSFSRVLKEINRIVEKIDPDIIHSQMPVSFIINAFLKTAKNNIKIHTDRGFYDKYRLPMRLLNRIAAQKMNCVITTTFYNARKWQKAVNVPIKVVPNTVSEIFGQFNEIKRKEIRNANGIKNSFVIGFAGRMTGLKNWPLAIEIVKRFKRTGSNFYVALALGVNLLSETEKQQAVQLVYELRSLLGNRLLYFENLSQEEMSNFYYLVDVFVLTSKFESFGRTAIEAMARKCCVLGTNVGGLPEVIGDPDLICNQNSECFVEKMLGYYKNHDHLVRKKTEMLIRFNTFFSQNSIAETQYRVYKRLLDKSRK